MNDKDPRSQVISKIKDVSNILVTVSNDPSVDQLSAALALTFVLDKIGKHATAVFSGDIPTAINFLNPEKTFENNANSLRDFIISLDKAKADRLRFKTEDDVVKVYITPYKTTISETDLSFSEGDFNVEMVIAIGVDRKSEVDRAIAAHGRILHDATVVTLNIDNDNDGLGSISWRETAASSFCEAMAGLVEDLGGSGKPTMDEQVATALLTGVVAATDQFRNEKTSPATMTLAANLMAKGANQQLISSELSSQESKESTDTGADQTQSGGIHGEFSLNHDNQPNGSNTQDANPGQADASGSEEANSVAEPALPQASTMSLEERVAYENKRVAEERSQAALRAAEAQLNETSIDHDNDANQEPATVASSEQPTLQSIVDESLAQIPTAPSVEATPPVNAVEQPTSEAALDDLVAKNQSISDMENELTQQPPQASPNFSHSTPYVEERFGTPINSSMMPAAETPITNPLFEPESPSQSVSDQIPMINSTPTPDLKPPAEPLLVNTHAATQADTSDPLSATLSAGQLADIFGNQSNVAQAISTEPGSGLPTPPRVPIPSAGMLPPVNDASSPIDTSSAGLPPMPNVVPDFSSATPGLGSPVSPFNAPTIDSTPSDPTQFQIPGR